MRRRGCVAACCSALSWLFVSLSAVEQVSPQQTPVARTLHGCVCRKETLEPHTGISWQGCGWPKYGWCDVDPGCNSASGMSPGYDGWDECRQTEADQLAPSPPPISHGDSNSERDKELSIALRPEVRQFLSDEAATAANEAFAAVWASEARIKLSNTIQGKEKELIGLDQAKKSLMSSQESYSKLNLCFSLAERMSAMSPGELRRWDRNECESLVRGITSQAKGRMPGPTKLEQYIDARVIRCVSPLCEARRTRMMLISTLAIEEELSAAGDWIGKGSNKYIVRTSESHEGREGSQFTIGGVAHGRSALTGHQLSAGPVIFVDSMCGDDENAGLSETDSVAGIARAVGIGRELASQATKSSKPDNGAVTTLLVAIGHNQSYQVPVFTFTERVGTAGSNEIDIRPWIRVFEPKDVDKAGCPYVGSVTLSLRTIKAPPTSAEIQRGPTGLMLASWVLDPVALAIDMRVVGAAHSPETGPANPYVLGVRVVGLNDSSQYRLSINGQVVGEITAGNVLAQGVELTVPAIITA